MQGRYFFIDIWATWCMPCIQEFNYYTSISKYLNSVNITKVFLSVDEKTDTQKWKDFIDDQHLAGYHFIINDTIQKQLFNIISKEKPESSFFIPQYLLYDKITDTFSIDLPRPSTGSVLQLVLDNILKEDSKRN
jgi:thiol-disulfide isomerase/thioredoxin